MSAVPPQRWEVRVQRPIAYDVIKAPALFDPANDLLMSFGNPHGRRFVVVDGTVDRLHGERIRGYFRERGIEALAPVPDAPRGSHPGRALPQS